MNDPRQPPSSEGESPTVLDGAVEGTFAPREGAAPASNDPEPDEMIGATLNGTYLVQRLLGEGGMGRVYEASHTRIARKRVAVKLLRAEMARDAAVLARFQREAETAAAVSHPNVIAVFDVDRTPTGVPFIVNEFLEGIDLSDYLDQVGHVDTDRAVHIVDQVCAALVAAHDKGVVHRDLKPQNVFLVGDFSHGVPPRPAVKVLDFGLSRFTEGSTTLTKTGVIMGTPSYMSPEQARGERVGPLTDVYATGALLYTLLTGHAPFREETPQMTVLAVLSRDPVRPRTILGTIPEGLEVIVQRAMAKDPADRYPEMAAFKAALEPFRRDSMVPPRLAMNTAPGSSSRTGAQMDGEAFALKTARPLLIYYLSLAVALAGGTLLLVVVGLGVLTGWLSFTATEFALVCVAIGGTALTPLILAGSWVRREVWNNSARVLGLLARLRVPLQMGFATVGATVVALLVASDVFGRFFGSADSLLRPGVLGWWGTTLLLPTLLLVGAGVAITRQALLVRGAGRWGRVLAGPVLFAAQFCLVAGATILALEARSGPRPGASTATIAAEPTPSGSTLPAASAGAPDDGAQHAASASAPASSTAGAAADKPLGPPAPEAELKAARTSGSEALKQLRQRFPRDPKVLEELMMAHSAVASEHDQAVAVATELFSLDPRTTGNQRIGLVLRRIGQTRTSAAKAARALMATGMGSDGPDLLYDMMTRHPGSAEAARALLSRPEVQEKATPALRIAYDLRTTKGCAPKLKLLNRAKEDGDARAAGVLTPLSRGSRRGCGRWKNKPCPPSCSKEAKAFRETIQVIGKRLRP